MVFLSTSFFHVLFKSNIFFQILLRHTFPRPCRQENCILQFLIMIPVNCFLLRIDEFWFDLFWRFCFYYIFLTFSLFFAMNCLHYDLFIWRLYLFHGSVGLKSQGTVLCWVIRFLNSVFPQIVIQIRLAVNVCLIFVQIVIVLLACFIGWLEFGVLIALITDWKSILIFQIM